jgi:large subunit ribosomal protein L15
MGKTATRGNKGQKARTGYKRKRNFEGGQQPLAKRLPKIGFTSRVVKPYAINVDRIKAVAELDEITVESIRSVHKMGKAVTKVKLVGATAKDLASKIKDENVTTTGK